MIRILFLLVLLLGSAGIGAAQEPQVVPGARVVSVSTSPQPPAFGRSFELLVTLRIRHGYAAALADSIGASEAIEATGPATLVTHPATGDSLEAVLSYPVFGYGSGRVDLPSIELWLRPATGGATAALANAREDLVRTGQRYSLPLGAVTIPQLAELSDSAAVAVPRPPADVVGGEWSAWFILAVGMLAAVGIGGIGRTLPRWWSATGGAYLARLRRESPRTRALRELERVRSLGWHGNGRVDDFYDSSTLVLREFARALDPRLTTALTSTELLAALSDRPAGTSTDALARAIETAERVKFGAARPSAEEAEADWETIRAWIQKVPER